MLKGILFDEKKGEYLYNTPNDFWYLFEEKLE